MYSSPHAGLLSPKGPLQDRNIPTISIPTIVDKSIRFERDSSEQLTLFCMKEGQVEPDVCE
jgi:hypothetical protein